MPPSPTCRAFFRDAAFVFRSLILAGLILTAAAVSLRAQTLDTIVFGNPSSESAHALSTGWGPVTPPAAVAEGGGLNPSDPSVTAPSEVIVGGLGQTARRLLPRKPNADVYGGEMDFTMTVDPVKQNYLTIKLWGPDPSSGVWLLLNIEGHELGLRHGGDSGAPETLFGNKQSVGWAGPQWVYRTVALPVHLTRGKTTVALKVRSLGWISDYDAGAYFGKYNKLMASPSHGLYRIYTHVGSQLDISGEAQGTATPLITPRAVENETTVLNAVKTGVNNQLAGYLNAAPDTLTGVKIRFLAECYDARENLGESWIAYPSGKTAADVIAQIVAGVDYQVTRQSLNSGYASGGWGGAFGEMGDGIRIVWPQLSPASIMSTTVEYGGDYGTVSRTTAWSRALRASVDFGRYNRRGSTANQEIHCVRMIYSANKALLLVDPSNALHEAEAVRYLKEGAGLLPYAGNDRPGGGPVPLKGTYPFGETWYLVTSRGTTKEGGFVASDYGEQGQFIHEMGQLSGDADLLAKARQILRARAVFRFPATDESGYRIMQGANPIGGRNRTLPGHYGYLMRNDGGTALAALGAGVIGADLLGYYQQAMSDGQALRMISGGVDPYLPRNYAAIKAMPATGVTLPMSVGGADFAWADEENMVVGARKGEDRFFANLHWSGSYVGGWAKVFRLPANGAPQLAEVQLEDQRYKPAGASVTLGPRVEIFARAQPPDNPVNAYNGTVWPLAMRSDLTSPPPANLDNGRGTGYTLRYGNWLVGINAHHADTYEVILPSNFTSGTDLISGAVLTGPVVLPPKTSAVFYLDDVSDPAPKPVRPLTLAATSTASGVILDWEPVPGATGYNVYRSTISGSGYVLLNSVGSSSYIDSSAVSGTTYYYVVSGVSSGGEGGTSPEAAATLKPAGLLNRATGGTATATASASSSPASQAFDGSTATKWNSGVTGVAAGLHYDFGFGITWAVTHYDITSADTASRDPAAWQFQGSNDGATWTTLDTRGGETFPTRGLTKSYSFTNTTGYRHHRLWITASSGGLGFELQLAELGLYAAGPGVVPAPAVPSGLAATSGENRVFLTWTASPSALSYSIGRAANSGGPFTTIATTGETCFLDTGAPAAGTWYYVVTAVNPGGESAPSGSVDAFFGTSAPATPTGVTGISGPDTGQITLRWNASPGVPTYKVYRSSGDAYTLVGTTSDTTYTDAGLTVGATYTYILSAANAAGESPASSAVAVTQATYTWSPAPASANWNVAANWTGGLAPGNGALLSFGASATTGLNNNFPNLAVSSLAFNAGANAFTLAGNSLTLAGDLTVNATATQTINLPLVLTGNRAVHANLGTLLLGGVISDGAGMFGLIKNGPGILALTGVNTFEGGLALDGGILQLGTSTGSAPSGNVASLGAPGGTVTVTNGTLRFHMGSNSTNTIDQNFVFNTGAVVLPHDGKITLGTAPRTLTVNSSTTFQSKFAGKWLQLAGLVSGTGEITLTNTNSGQISAIHFTNGNNPYNGTLTIDETTSGYAALALGHNTALRFADIFVNNTRPGSSAIWFDTTAPVIGSLAGVADSGIMLNTDGGVHGPGPSPANSAVTLTVGGSHADTTFDGTLSGTGGLVKTGGGTFTLTATHTYTGLTTVNGGTLDLAGGLAGAVTVNDGGILAGIGNVSGTVTLAPAGILSPGRTGAGTITLGGLTLHDDSILAFDLAAATASDRIVTAACTAPASGTATLVFTPLPGFSPGTYPLITGAAGISAGSFTIGTAAPAGYTYALSAVGDTLDLVVTGPPPAPVGVFAYGKSAAITLAWEASGSATSYIIYRSTSADGTYTNIGTTGATTFTNTGLTNGTAYHYRLVAVNPHGESAASAVVTATPGTNTWIAAPSSLNWSLPANWGGNAPVNHAQLTFGASNATNLTNDLSGLTVGGLLFNGGAGAFTFSGNAVTLTGDIVNNSTSLQTINLDLLLIGDRTVTTNTGQITFGGIIGDDGQGHGLVKTGGGTLRLNAANTFTGGVTVTAGTLHIGHSGALGTGVLTATAGTVTLGGGTLENDLFVPAGSTVNLVKAGFTSFNGDLVGGGTINESGNVNALHWNGDNGGFTGTITSANSGGSHRWRFNTETAGSAKAAWILNCTAPDAYGFNLGTGTVAFGSLSGGGVFRNDSGNSTVTLRIGDLGASTTFSGQIGGNGNNNFIIQKVGAGTFTLSGVNTYGGAAVVEDGTLNITGSIVTGVTVKSGATLAGTGAIGGVVSVAGGGTLAPGHLGAGTLTIKSLALANGSILRFELGATSDQLALDGAYGTYAAVGTTTINIGTLAGFAPGTYTLITGANGINAGNFTAGSLPANYVCAFSVSGGSLLATLRVPGASFWTGTASGDWNDPSNWGGLPPLAQDSLLFTGSPFATLHNDLVGFVAGGLLFDGGAAAFTLGGNALALHGDITNNSTSAQLLSLPIILTTTSTVTTNTGAITLSGVVGENGGSHGFVKEGDGTFTLGGANTFTGGVTVNAGTLSLAGISAGASPSGGGTITLNHGATLRISGGTANTIVAGDLHVPAGATVNLVKASSASGNGGTIAGNLTGGGTIHESGNINALHWNGDNRGFTGAIISANSGAGHRWRFNTAAAGSATAAWTLNADATDAYGFAFGTGTISFGSLAGSGVFRNNSSGTVTLRVGDLGASTTFSGSIIANGGAILALDKVGAGALTISGANNTYTGATTITAGTLNLTGTLAGTSGITVAPGGTLAGTSTITKPAGVSGGGALAPGNVAVGTLTFSGGLTLHAGSVLNLELATAAASDRIAVTGAYTAPVGGTVTINVTALGGFGQGTYTLITGATGISVDSFTPGTLPVGYTYALSAADGTLSLAVTALSAYEQWKLAHGLTLTTADTATPDGDGVSVLLKYATGLTPGSPAASAPVTAQTAGDHLTLHFNRPSPAIVTYTVEASDDLATWTPLATLAAGSDTWGGTADVIESVSGDLRAVTVTDPADLTLGPRRFLRLRVSR